MLPCLQLWLGPHVDRPVLDRVLGYIHLVKFFTHKNVFLSYYKAVDKLQQENNICYTN